MGIKVVLLTLFITCAYYSLGTVPSDTLTVLKSIETGDALKTEFPDSSLHIFKAARTAAINIKWFKGCKKADGAIGKLYQKIGEYDSAYVYFQSGLEHSRLDNDHFRVAIFRLKQADIQQSKGNFNKAYRLAKESHLWFERNDPIRFGSGQALNIMAMCMKAQGLFEKAIEYYNLSQEKHAANNNNIGVINTIINTALACGPIKKHLEQKQHVNQALKLSKTHNYSKGLSQSYSLLSSIYQREEKLNVSLLYLDSAKHIILASGNAYRIAGIKAKEGLLLTKHGDYTKAQITLHEAMEISTQIGAKDITRHVHETFHKLYKKTFQFKDALHHFEISQRLNDSLYNRDKKDEIKTIQHALEMEMKDKALVESKYQEGILRAKKAEAEKLLALKDRNTAEKLAERNLVIIIALITALIGGYVYYRLRVRKKAQQLLEEKNILTEELLRKKEAMLGEIHHRVKNNLQLVASMLALQASQTKNIEAKRVFAASSARIESMSLIHQKLYQNMDYQRIALSEYTQHLAHQIINTYSPNNSIKLKLDIQDITLHIDTVVPLGLILNEWLTNSIKYAFPNKHNPEIEIAICANKTNITVNYKDNGKGIPEDSKSGFGTHLIASLGRQLKASFIHKNDDGYHIIMTAEKYNIVS